MKSLRVEELSSLRAAGQCGFSTATRAHGSSPSLRASAGCVAIQASPVEGLKSLKVDKLLITHQLFNLSTFKQKQAKLAFTMAEILLSLTIIGVVAAITLPSLTGNINERTWNTQRKALYSRISQASALLPSINNYGTSDSNAAETFITKGLSNVLKINNICAAGNTIFDCGIPSQITPISGPKIGIASKISDLNEGITNIEVPGLGNIRDTEAAAFETANGESILTFYNPECKAANVLIKGTTSSGLTEGLFVKQQVCVNLVYDLNGKKGPNTVGKDIGAITIVYPSDPKVVMPINPRKMNGPKDYATAAKDCQNLDQGNYRLPNIEELLSLYYNKALLGGVSDSAFGEGSLLWSGTAVDSTKVNTFGGKNGTKYFTDKNLSHNFMCVER